MGAPPSCLDQSSARTWSPSALGHTSSGVERLIDGESAITAVEH